MTKVFIHIEAQVDTPSNPYRLSACDAGMSRVFASSVLWPGREPIDDYSYRVCGPGNGTVSTTDKSSVVCCGEPNYVVGAFHEWVGDLSAAEFWTKSIQESWRSYNGLGLHTLPLFDLSTFLRVNGLDFGKEVLLASRKAAVRAGATSQLLGAYMAAFLYQTGAKHKA